MAARSAQPKYFELKSMITKTIPELYAYAKILVWQYDAY